MEEFLKALLAARYRLGGGGWAEEGDEEPQEAMPLWMHKALMGQSLNAMQGRGAMQRAKDEDDFSDTGVEARYPNRAGFNDSIMRMFAALEGMSKLGNEGGGWAEEAGQEQGYQDMADFGPYPNVGR